MRVGIGFIGDAVRGPAGVANAAMAVNRLLVSQLTEVEKLAFRTQAVQRGKELRLIP